MMDPDLTQWLKDNGVKYRVFVRYKIEEDDEIKETNTPELPLEFPWPIYEIIDAKIVFLDSDDEVHYRLVWK